MATIKEKLILEREKQNNEIILHREGIFYIAYEHSAWLFTVAIHNFKVKKQYIKCVAQDVVSIGFPMTSLENLASGCEITDEGGVLHLLLPAGRLPQKNDFENWKFLQHHAKGQEEQTTHVSENNAPLAKKLELLKMINDFPIECKTPLECMLFLSEIKTAYKDL